MCGMATLVTLTNKLKGIGKRRVYVLFYGQPYYLWTGQQADSCQCSDHEGEAQFENGDETQAINSHNKEREITVSSMM